MVAGHALEAIVDMHPNVRSLWFVCNDLRQTAMAGSSMSRSPAAGRASAVSALALRAGLCSSRLRSASEGRRPGRGKTISQPWTGTSCAHLALTVEGAPQNSESRPDRAGFLSSGVDSRLSGSQCPCSAHASPAAGRPLSVGLHIPASAGYAVGSGSR